MTANRIQCVLASGNQGKLAELSDALSAHGIDLVSQQNFNVSEADENAPTFIENALIKARHASHKTGLSALADDSGLVVPALKGAPGIYSARYAASAEDNSDQNKPSDQNNIDKLLQALTQFDDEASRAAYFVCVLTYLRHADDPEPLVATGIWHGHILKEAQGEGGFGYDPIFYCPKQMLSAAAMGKAKKRQVSHRAIAIKELNQKLSETLSTLKL